MLSAIREYLPLTTGCYKPEGGMFLWIRLPKLKIKPMTLLEDALRSGVAFVYGSVFYPYNVDSNFIRLNFSNACPEEIDIGIERLGEVVAKGM